MPALNPEDLDKPVAQFMRRAEVSVATTDTVAQAIDAIRAAQPQSRILYVYAHDDTDRLVGVVSTRALLTSPADRTIGDAMSPHVVTIPHDATLDLALDLFALHRLLALPVVDDATGQLRGVLDVQIYAEEMLDLAETRRNVEVFQLIGVTADTLREHNPVKLAKARLPWLGVNLLAGLACAGIAAAFNDTLAHALVLAMFIPLVLTLSESAAMQTVTLGLPQLEAAGVKWSRWWKQQQREWLVAALMGATLALTVGLIALLWRSGPTAPLVIALATLTAVLTAATLGTLVPLCLHALKLDPKLAAGPVALALTDIATMTVYLSLGAAML